jgi:hypothetical protein
MDLYILFILFIFILIIGNIINNFYDITEHMTAESNLSIQNIASIYNTNNMNLTNLQVSQNITSGQNITGQNITSKQKIAAQGTDGGLQFFDRQSQDKNYEWLSQNGTANLYNSFNGAYITQIDQSGNITTNGGVFAKGSGMTLSANNTNQISLLTDQWNGLQIRNKDGQLLGIYSDNAYFNQNISAPRGITTSGKEGITIGDWQIYQNDAGALLFKNIKLKQRNNGFVASMKISPPGSNSSNIHFGSYREDGNFMIGLWSPSRDRDTGWSTGGGNSPDNMI